MKSVKPAILPVMEQVPMVSADYINIPNTNKYYVKDGNHAELSSTNGVRDLILEILNGNVNNLG